ncbi:bacteriophage N4 receptor, outer membrane subunit [Escherichia coli]|uniref:Bacteriophage N4 receptor, outer membrane subunit n=1 Tax=Escherichia coli TaxID=562 RepID=A0A376LJJ0_ECOLX|nr:bacteriophage N4 receptor, outer membrane subunit [Escherichia coli]
MSAAQRQGKAIVATGNWKPSTASDAICCLEGDLLSVYSRVFADTGENGVMMPVKNPMSGTGLRWKPLRDQIFFLAVEQQLPLNGQNGASDTMLRASALISLMAANTATNGTRTVQAGLPKNLYLDAAQYVRQDIQAWTARLSRQLASEGG